VTGAALVKDEARVTVVGVPDRPGVVHSLFRQIAEANIVVDMIVQNVATDGATEVSFTVAAEDLAETLHVTDSASRSIGAGGVTHDADVSKISVVGLGMKTHTGVATAMFEALAHAGINIQMITTSEIKISVLVDRALAAPALRAVHKAFNLDEPVRDTPGPYHPRRQSGPLSAGVPATADNGGRGTTSGMEDLVISGVELDQEQGRVTVLNVPDQPGYAGRVFRRIAEAGILVDMIVQNVSTAGTTHLSFTVPPRNVERAAEAITNLAPGNVVVEPRVAKLSVMGVGMRTHTGVATRMFGALAARGINIVLINTSEVRINVAMALDRGAEGLECLKETFLMPG
jgi:aspartate kinase